MTTKVEAIATESKVPLTYSSAQQQFTFTTGTESSYTKTTTRT